MSQRTSSFILGGGLDMITPPLQIQPGRVLGGYNYEPLTTGGYRRIDGYERFDGRLSPTDAQYWQLPFTAGAAAFSVGDIVDGVTSSAQGEVIAVVLETGAWDGTGAGYIILTDVTGQFIDAENLQVSAATKAVAKNGSGLETVADDALHQQYLMAARETRRARIQTVPGEGPILGVWMLNDVVYAFRNNVGQTACLMYKSSATGWKLVTTPALNPGGQYEFITYNFGGAAGTRMMYGCDGKNKAFQFDGATFTQITTGMTVDAPEHLAAHKKHLFLSFDTSVQYSPIGDPTGTWSVVTGAGEIATGEQVVGFDVLAGGVLAIFNRNATYLLYGTPGAADFQLRAHNENAGAIGRTIQHFNEPIYLDDRGLTTLSASQVFGDFEAGTISHDIDPWLQNLKAGILSSIRIRGKNQYRLFFDDFSALLMLFNGQQPQFMALDLPVLVKTVCSVEHSSGEEHIYFGSDDGYIYRMDRGDSFDGAVINYSMRLAFNSLGSPVRKKRFFKVLLEVSAPMPFPIQYLAEYSYGSPDKPASVGFSPTDATVRTGGGFFDTRAVWGQFIFDGQTVGTAESYLEGDGVNISMMLSGESNYEPAHTLYGGTYFYAMRGLKR